MIGIRDNEDLSIKEHLVAGIYTYLNQANFYDEKKNAYKNLIELDSIKKEYPYLQAVAGLVDCLKECNILLRVFHQEYKSKFTDTDRYLYATLLRNISSFRASLLLVYHGSEFAMIASLRQAYEQIGYCSYIIKDEIDIFSGNTKSPNNTVGYLNDVIPGLNRIYGDLSEKTHINFSQFNFYYDKENDKVIDRSLNNVVDFVHLFGEISEAQIAMIDIFMKKCENSDVWYRKKLREYWASHNSKRTNLTRTINEEQGDFSFLDIMDEYKKLPPIS